MVQTPPNHQDQLIDHTLSWLRNAIADTETLSPDVKSPRPAQPKDVIPETPVQEERKSPLVDHSQSLVEDVAVAVPEKPDTTSTMHHPIAKQTSDDVLPAELSVPQEQTDSLIDQTLSLVETVTEVEEPEETPSAMQQPVAKQTSDDLLPAELSVTQEQTDPLIDQTLSLVETVSELEEPEETPSAMQQPVAKQPPSDVQLTEPARNASLIEQTLSLARNIAVPEPKVAPPSLQQPRAKQLTPKERLDMERADIQQRVATFKANQQRFQKEREEYYTTTMAKARATQSPKP